MNKKHSTAFSLSELASLLTMALVVVIGYAVFVRESNFSVEQTPLQASPAAQVSESSPLATLDQQLADCNAFPSNSTQRVIETTRLFIHLPRDIYPYTESNVQIQTVKGNATMGLISNGGWPGVDLEDTPTCWSTYYELDGAGEVDFIVKSILQNTPDYRVRFLVSQTR